MPFVVPTVATHNGANSVVICSCKADPTAEQLASYIEWLERELDVAKVAYEAKAGEKWIETPATERAGRRRA